MHWSVWRKVYTPIHQRLECTTVDLSSRYKPVFAPVDCSKGVHTLVDETLLECLCLAQCPPPCLHGLAMVVMVFVSSPGIGTFFPNDTFPLLSELSLTIENWIWCIGMCMCMLAWVCACMYVCVCETVNNVTDLFAVMCWCKRRSFIRPSIVIWC